MQALCFLAAITAALPRIHRSAESTRLCCFARLPEAAVTITQQRSSDFGHSQIKQRKHEQLIPEDMAAVGFAMQAARRHPDIEVYDMRRGGLDQVQDVQPQNFLGLLFLIPVDVLDIEVETIPKVFPLNAVSSEQFIESR